MIIRLGSAKLCEAQAGISLQFLTGFHMKLRFVLSAVLASFTALWIASGVVATAADPAGRFALVIANARYPDAEAPLKEPLNDAREISAELKRDGFEVDSVENLSGDAMRRALDKFYARIKPGSVALVFYSGYGIQSARQSYLIPVDAQIWAEPDVRRDGISIDTVLGEINARGAGVKIALLDASRRNPFERRFRSFSAGLAPVIAPSGSLVMYSAALSSVVSDNGRDRSLFVSELLKEIRVPNLMAEETLNRTRIGVTRASGGAQVPWISSSLAEEFSFIPGQTAPEPVVAAAQPREEIIAPPAATPAPPAPPAVIATAPVTPAPVPAPAPTSPVAAAPAAIATPARDESRIEIALADDPTVKTLNARISAKPDDAAALYRRGQVYARKGAYRLALRDFDSVIRLSPRDAEAFNNRCWVRTVSGELQGALKDCNEALQLRPGFVDALDSRGLLHLKSNQPKNAIADFDAALKINPRLTSSLYGRGLARKLSGATAEGELDVNNARAMDPNIVKEFADYGLR